MNPEHQNSSFEMIIGILITLLSGALIMIFVMLYQRRKGRRESAQQRTIDLDHNDLLRSNIEIKDQILQHISQELQDNLGQVASLIKINLNTILPDLPPNAITKVEETKALVWQLIRDVKVLSLSVSDDQIMQIGFASALQKELDRIERTGQYRITTNMKEIPRLKKQVTFNLYWMAREILQNIIAHSLADSITVCAHQRKNLFILDITDNGVGFDKEKNMSNSGTGLLKMKSRARLIEGDFFFETAPGKGTKMHIVVPIAHAPN